MGYDVGAAGAFGLLLSDYADKLGDLYQKFLDGHEALVEELSDDEDYEECELDDEVQEWAEAFVPRFVKAFAKLGIVVPEGVRLHPTGDEDERPGRTETDADDWVLGFGMLKKPWTYPKMHKSFRQAADWHTWVWGG
jgi:hypothetical protein